MDYFNKIERFWCQVDPRTTPSGHWNGVLGAQMPPSWSWTGVLGAQMAPRWHWNGGLGAQMAPSWHWNGVLGDQMAPSWPWTGVLGAQIVKTAPAAFPRSEAKTGNLWIYWEGSGDTNLGMKVIQGRINQCGTVQATCRCLGLNVDRMLTLCHDYAVTSLAKLHC